jgi:hypothetical protein
VRCREVAVRDVDRDALLAFGAQAVGQQGEVDVVGATPLADGLDVLELVLEDRPISVDVPSSTLPTVAKRSGASLVRGSRSTNVLTVRCPR